MLENTGPTTKSTLSRSINCLTLPTATSGFSSSSCTTMLVVKPPSLPPACLTPRLKPSRSCQPNTACGPDSTAMMPILSSWASAVAAERAPTAMMPGAASHLVVLINFFILIPSRRGLNPSRRDGCLAAAHWPASDFKASPAPGQRREPNWAQSVAIAPLLFWRRANRSAARRRRVARGARAHGPEQLLRYQGAIPQVQEVEKLAQPQLLMADQMPRFGQHALHHDLGLIPIPVQAGLHEIIARPRAGTMTGDDRGDHGRQVVNDLHANLIQYGSAGPL